MKKYIVLIAIVSLVMINVVFADEFESAGEQLKEYGIINGNENGDLLEDELLNRAEMMVLLVDLYGDREELDGKYIKNLTFTDIDKNIWYAPFVAYGQVKGLTSGVGDNKFNPQGMVSKQEMSKFLLNVLGYEGKWEDSLSYANSLKIDIDVIDDTKLLRGEVFELILKTLDVKVYGEDISLKEILNIEDVNIKKEFFEVEKAEIVGLQLMKMLKK